MVQSPLDKPILSPEEEMQLIAILSDIHRVLSPLGVIFTFEKTVTQKIIRAVIDSCKEDNWTVDFFVMDGRKKIYLSK
jgi:hypothetical protein